MLTVFFIASKRTYFGAQASSASSRRLEASDGPGARDAIRRDIIDGGVDFFIQQTKKTSNFQ